MTNRLNAVIVVLDRDIRDDDATEIVTALSMEKGVLSVERISVDTAEMIAHARAFNVIRGRMLEALMEER